MLFGLNVTLQVFNIYETLNLTEFFVAVIPVNLICIAYSLLFSLYVVLRMRRLRIPTHRAPLYLPPTVMLLSVVGTPYSHQRRTLTHFAFRTNHSVAELG